MATNSDMFLDQFRGMADRYQDLTPTIENYRQSEEDALAEMAQAQGALDERPSGLRRGVDIATRIGGIIAAIADKTSGNKARRKAVGGKMETFRKKLKDIKEGRSADKEKRYQQAMRGITNRREFARNTLNAEKMMIESQNQKLQAKMGVVKDVYNAKKGSEVSYKDAEWKTANEKYKNSGMNESDFAKSDPYSASILGIKDTSIPAQKYIDEAEADFYERDPMYLYHAKQYELAIENGADFNSDEVQKHVHGMGLRKKAFLVNLNDRMAKAGYAGYENVPSTANPTSRESLSGYLLPAHKGGELDPNNFLPVVGGGGGAEQGGGLDPSTPWLERPIETLPSGEERYPKIRAVAEIIQQIMADEHLNKSRVKGSPSADTRVGNRFYDYGIKQ